MVYKLRGQRKIFGRTNLFNWYHECVKKRYRTYRVFQKFYQICFNHKFFLIWYICKCYMFFKTRVNTHLNLYNIWIYYIGLNVLRFTKTCFFIQKLIQIWQFCSSSTYIVLTTKTLPSITVIKNIILVFIKTGSVLKIVHKPEKKEAKIRRRP